MIRFLTDEHIDPALAKGLLKQNPDVDIVRVQEVGLRGASDEVLLDWAASTGRILISNDGKTMPGFAYDRVGEGKPMSGVIIVPDDLSFGEIIEDLLMIVGASQAEDWEGRVEHLPL